MKEIIKKQLVNQGVWIYEVLLQDTNGKRYLVWRDINGDEKLIDFLDSI